MIQLISAIKPGRLCQKRLSNSSKVYYKKILKREQHFKKYYNILGFAKKTRVFSLKDENQEMDRPLMFSKHLL
jgi:hypothetical protein